jgi:cytoskeleton protein RodZ
MIDTIGQRLKNAREYRHLTLEKAAEATRIRQGYLQALEADDFSAMPSPVQARGFLRNYAQYLDLDLDQIVEELRANRPEPEGEVIFEDEETKSTPEPLTENETSEVETSAEPFWQTWLNRVKREVGEVVEDSASQPDSSTAYQQAQDDTQQPSSGYDQARDNGLGRQFKTATQVNRSEQHPESAPVSEPESTLETDAGQSMSAESPEEEIGEGSQTKTRLSFMDWVKYHYPGKQTDNASAMVIEEEPESEPETEIEPETEAQPETSSEPAISSQEIINEIGMELRQRREMLSLTLDEIERHTRMRAQFMEALEKGNFDELPSPVQTRGMLTNYASFLDLDVDALLLRFADALQARHRERHPEKPARRRGQPDIPENLPALRSFIAGDVVFGVGMVLLLISFSVWGISRVIALQAEQQTEVQAEATGPSISEALIGTPVETVVSQVTLIPAEDTPIPELVEGTVEIPTLDVNANVQVNIVAIERSFLRVTVDGEVVYEGRTIPGNAYPFDAEQSIEILAGNGAALRVIYNQRDLGILGGFGQIASFIYTPDGILIPTPNVPPTATITPFSSLTPSTTPSLTPSPSVTPTNTPTEASE